MRAVVVAVFGNTRGVVDAIAKMRAVSDALVVASASVDLLDSVAGSIDGVASEMVYLFGMAAVDDYQSSLERPRDSCSWEPETVHPLPCLSSDELVLPSIQDPPDTSSGATQDSRQKRRTNSCLLHLADTQPYGLGEAEADDLLVSSTAQCPGSRSHHDSVPVRDSGRNSRPLQAWVHCH